jgi:hypothetical protein
LHRKYLLEYSVVGKIAGVVEATGKQGSRRKQLLDDLNKTIGYWKLKEKALDRTL